MPRAQIVGVGVALDGEIVDPHERVPVLIAERCISVSRAPGS
jgi:hypothetical protein